MNKTWIKYLSKEFLKTFLFFTFCFYLLYTIIDYSSNIKSFFNASIPLKDLLIFYIFQISKRADLLIPLSAMLASIRVLTKLNFNRELLAMQAGGFSLKKILAPFLAIALIISLMIALNFEFLTPYATESIENFEDVYFNNMEKRKKNTIYQIDLTDSSKLIYQNYESKNKRFYDSYWIKNNNEIYSIKYLYPYSEVPIGIGVNRIIETETHQKALGASYESYSFDGMYFNMQNFEDAILPYENRPISSLWKSTSIFQDSKKRNEHDSLILSQLTFKICVSLATILSIMVTATACITFSRQIRIFVIYSVSVFGLLSFFTILNSGLVLAENMILDPFVSMLLPTAIFMIIASYKIAKLD